MLDIHTAHVRTMMRIALVLVALTVNPSTHGVLWKAKRALMALSGRYYRPVDGRPVSCFPLSPRESLVGGKLPGYAGLPGGRDVVAQVGAPRPLIIPRTLEQKREYWQLYSGEDI